MNVVKKVLIGLFATVVVLALISYLLPSRVRVERSITIKAPAERVYEPVATLNTWKEWTAWNKTEYPKMEWDYKGPEAGVGAESKWTDAKAGDGHLKITKADPKEGIEYDLTFGGMPTIPGSIKFSPTDQSGNETKVIWFFEQDTGWNPMNRYICAFFLDRWVGKDFDTGLAGLKKRVEGDGGELKPSADAPADDKPVAEALPAEKPAESTPPVKQE